VSTRMRIVILAGLVVLAGALGTLAFADLLAPNLFDRQAATITPDSVREAKLERNLGSYKARFAGHLDEAYPVTEAYAADWHLYALLWRDEQVAAYAPRSENRAIGLFTWSPADRTAERIGPCSSVDDLRAAYRGRLEPFSHHGQVRAYRAGTIVFVVDSAGKRVRLVQVSTAELGPLAGVQLQAGCRRRG